MRRRGIIYEHGADDQIEQLGVDYERYDALTESLNETLSSFAEMFPTIPGTRLSICKTNEFVGGTFSEIPSLALFFYYDEDSVHVVAVEQNDTESYGF